MGRGMVVVAVGVGAVVLRSFLCGGRLCWWSEIGEGRLRGVDHVVPIIIKKTKMIAPRSKNKGNNQHPSS